MGSELLSQLPRWTKPPESRGPPPPGLRWVPVHGLPGKGLPRRRRAELPPSVLTAAPCDWHYGLSSLPLRAAVAFDSYRSKNPDSEVKTDYLRWPQNKVRNKCNPLESPPNHPPPGPWENCLPQNRPVVPEKLGTPDPESSLQVSDVVPKSRQEVLQSTVCIRSRAGVLAFEGETELPTQAAANKSNL